MLRGIPSYLLISIACWGQTYTITTVAGIGSSGYSGDGSPAMSAQLSGPSRVAIDQAGSLYIADQFNQRVRQVSPSGTISTIAGNGTGGYSGDGKSASAAELDNPFAVVVDSSGTYYITDSSNNVVRKVAGGTISTVAGIYSAGPGYSGDGGAGISALVNHPTGLALDSAGNLYIADTPNNVIRMLSGGN